MMKHVLTACSMVFLTSAEEEKRELTFDDPIEMHFPEMALTEAERAIEKEWKDEPEGTKKQMNVGKVIEMYNAKVTNLSPERAVEYNTFQAAKNDKWYGKETGNAMRCEQLYKKDNKWSEQFIWDQFGFEDLGGALWLDEERYTKYVHNQPEKPWLLMMVKTPYGSVDTHYQTFEVIMSRIYCAAKAMDINFGVIDLWKEENIKESFYYNDGDYGFGVPYYVYVKDNKAVHLEQKLWQTQPLVAALKKAQEGEGYMVESRKAPRNSVTIFWEYAQRDVGKLFNQKTMFPLMEYLDKNLEHPVWIFYEKWFAARRNGEKGAGFHVFCFFIFPAAFMLLMILRCIMKCICRTICGSSKKSKTE